VPGDADASAMAIAACGVRRAAIMDLCADVGEKHVDRRSEHVLLPMVDDQAFQKQIRLQQARLLLATQPNDVTAISRRVGYDSPSQFSREYRRQFGAPPSQDAARLRDATLTPALPLP
jgi:AraC-like DNA-binding protein